MRACPRRPPAECGCACPPSPASAKQRPSGAGPPIVENVPRYDKLIRDGIPAHLDSLGIAFETRRLEEDEYLERLIEKVGEELAELVRAVTDEERREELADLLEASYALADQLGGREAVEAARVAKLAARGGFEERILLVETD